MIERMSRNRECGRRDVRVVRVAGAGAGVGSLGAESAGALAVGALAGGAVALGAVAIGRLVIGRAVIRHLRIEELEVGRLRVGELEGEGGSAATIADRWAVSSTVERGPFKP